METNTSFKSSFSTLLDKTFVQLESKSETFLKDLKVGFFIDVSGSTSDKFNDAGTSTVLDVEKQFVNEIINKLATDVPPVVAWSNHARNISDISCLNSAGGTDPVAILNNESTYATLKDCDVAVIVTDGQIDGHAIRDFGDSMIGKATHLKAIIGVIVGRRSSRMQPGVMKKPQEINVSVLVPAMVSNGCILFFNSYKTYIMWYSGCFGTAWKPTDIDDTVDWPAVTTVEKTLDLTHVKIPIHDPNEEIQLREAGYIPFGSGLYFNPTLLLLSKPTFTELQSYPMHQICQYFRVTHQCDKLRNWLAEQKENCTKNLLPIDEDDTLNKLANEVKLPCSERNRNVVESFCKSRDLAVSINYVNSGEKSLPTNYGNNRVATVAHFFDNLIYEVSEDLRNQHVGASYTCRSISNSRYCGNSPPAQRRINTKSNSQSGPVYFDKPLKWLEKFENENPTHSSTQLPCGICMDNGVPFVLLRKIITKNDILDMVENPLTYFYPQHMCAKCSEYFCIRKKDPVRQDCIAALPIVNLQNDNSLKNYLECFGQFAQFGIMQFVINTVNLLESSVTEDNEAILSKNSLKFVLCSFVDIIIRHLDEPEMKPLLENFGKYFE